MDLPYPKPFLLINQESGTVQDPGKISPLSYKLEFSASMSRNHPVISVVRLEQAKTDSFDREIPRRAPIIVQGLEQRVVEKIIARKKRTISRQLGEIAGVERKNVGTRCRCSRGNGREFRKMSHAYSPESTSQTRPAQEGPKVTFTKDCGVAVSLFRLLLFELLLFKPSKVNFETRLIQNSPYLYIPLHNQRYQPPNMSTAQQLKVHLGIHTILPLTMKKAMDTRQMIATLKGKSVLVSQIRKEDLTIAHRFRREVFDGMIQGCQFKS